MFEFLAGLNSKYEQVRAQILNMNLSSLNELYVHIHKEEGKRGVINVQSVVKKSAFISTFSQGGRGDSTCGCGGRFSTYDDCDCLNCEHCGRCRHTKD